MKNILLFILFIFLLIPAVYAQEKTIYLNLIYSSSEEKFWLESIDVNYGTVFLPPVVEEKPVYILKILDKNYEQLFSNNFSAEIKVFDMPPPSNVSLVLMLPYFSTGKSINILKDSLTLFSIDLELICNKNNVCDNYENYFSCPQDCLSGSSDGTCDKLKDGICDTDCVPDVDPDCIITTTTTTAKITTTTIQLCNKNKKCEPRLGENYNTCPQDCLSGSSDGYCDKLADGICDLDCTENEDPDCKKPSMLWIYILVGIVIIILLIVFLTRIRGEKGIERTKQFRY
jgi:hypothetical protein